MNWPVILLMLCITYHSDGSNDLNEVNNSKKLDVPLNTVVGTTTLTNESLNELRSLRKLYEQQEEYYENKTRNVQNNYELLQDKYIMLQEKHILLQEKHIVLHERLVAAEHFLKSSNTSCTYSMVPSDINLPSDNNNSNSQPTDNISQNQTSYEHGTFDPRLQPRLVTIYEKLTNASEDTFVPCNCTNQDFDKIKRKKKTRGKYLGCFQDQLDRVFKGYCLISRSMTVERCIDICRNGNYVYAGLQYGETCSCDNTIQFDELSEDKCDVVCTGDDDQNYGGHWTNSIYETGIEYYLMDEEGRELPDSYITPSAHCSIRLQGDGKADP